MPKRTFTWEIRIARWRWRRCNDDDGVYCPSFWFNWINDTPRSDSNLRRAELMISAAIQQRRNSSSEREMMSIETNSICFSPFPISRVHIQSKINYFSLQHSAESSFVEWIRIRVDFNSISFNTLSEERLSSPPAAPWAPMAESDLVFRSVSWRFQWKKIKYNLITEEEIKKH